MSISEEVDLGFRVGGRIASIPVEEGAHVKTGDLLASLDRGPVDDRAAQAQAQTAQAQAQLAKLENGSPRAGISTRPRRGLRPRAPPPPMPMATMRAASRSSRPARSAKAIWEQTVAARDKAHAALAEAKANLSLVQVGPRPEDIAAAKAAVSAAKAAQASVNTDTGDTRLKASEDGTVLTRAREPGAIVAPGETVFTLAIDRPLRVRAYIAEDQLSRIAPGMAVTVTRRRQRQELSRYDRLYFAARRVHAQNRADPATCAPISSIGCASS